MKHSFKAGFSFGVTSAIITTLGLMVGLEAGTNSKLAVLGGILTIAIADAFSDSLGMHISQEAKKGSKSKNVWESTMATFISKFAFAMTFFVPVLLLELSTAIYASIFWGLLLIGLLSYKIGYGKSSLDDYNISKRESESRLLHKSIMRERKANSLKAVTEHLLIAATVIVVAHFTGELIARIFG